jgi:hypothetical protein
MKPVIAFTCLLLLAGCSSDVDKCVDAHMKSWEQKQTNTEITNAAEARALYYRICLAMGKK